MGRGSRFILALCGGTALLSGLFVNGPAFAQNAATLQAIQAQITQLQTQLKQLQRQSAQREAELKQAQDDAAQAGAAAQKTAVAAPAAVPAAVTAAPPPGYLPVFAKAPATSNDPVKTFQVGGASITLGGYFDLAGLYRSRNLTSGTSTSFNSIPFNNATSGHTGEFRMTAQNTRLAVLLEGKAASALTVAAYIESDFDGAATTSNSNQSNSYTPRLRHAYMQADDTDLGLHGLAGQTWSLASSFMSGMTPRKEAIPITIDNNYLPGFVYTRTPELRVVKDFDKTYWVGLSLEGPQELYGFGNAVGATVASGGTLPAGVNGRAATITYNNPGGSFLNSGTNYSFDTAPDMILKGAVDTRFGHYEAYGLGRWFKTRSAVTGSATDQTVFGGGLGGSFYVPIVPKYVEFVGNILGGYGVGRYGTGQLPDATFESNGSPAPLPGIIGSVGLLGHPTPTIDLYSYFGTEQVGRGNYRTSTGSIAGYGAGTVNVSGCDIETGTIATAPTCNAQTRSLWGVNTGAWWKFLHGSFGTLQAGASYSYTRRTAFHGAFNTSGSVGRTPDTDESIVMFSLRYLPFL